MASYLTALTTVANVGTQNAYATNEIPVDMESKLMTSTPSERPFTVISRRLMQQRKAKNVRVDWIEEADFPTTVLATAAVAANGTSLVISANGPTLVAGTVLFYPGGNGELLQVDSTPAANTVTVTRGVGGTTAAAIPVGAELRVLPPSVPEDTTANRNVSLVNTNQYNVVQLIKMGYSLTRTSNALPTAFGGPGSKRQMLRQKKWQEVSLKKELMYYFGGRSQTGTAPATVGMMGGFRHFLSNGTLYKDFNGQLTETGLRNLMVDYKSVNPDISTVWAFVASNVHELICRFSLNNLRSALGTEKWGIDVREYQAAGVKINLVPLPLLSDSITRGWGWFLDMERISVKPLEALEYVPDPDTNKNTSENIIDVYRGSETMMLANESRHIMITGAYN